MEINNQSFKKALVNKIKTVSYDEVTLENETLPVGRTYRNEVMQRLHID